MATKFKPNYAVHPGTILADDLAIAGISQKELSKRIGVSKTIVNETIKGKRNINAKLAVLLETVLDFKAEYWLRLQSLYDEAAARLELNKSNNESSNDNMINTGTPNDFFKPQPVPQHKTGFLPQGKP